MPPASYYLCQAIGIISFKKSSIIEAVPETAICIVRVGADFLIRHRCTMSSLMRINIAGSMAVLASYLCARRLELAFIL